MPGLGDHPLLTEFIYLSACMRQIPALDGLRGIAIIMVIAFHYFNYASLFSFGWMGVDLFFVLSGYLITGGLLTTINHPGYFRNFYRNRILRIFPLYFFTLTVFYITICFFVAPAAQTSLTFYFAHWKAYFLFFVNWTFIRYGMPSAAFLNHFWTLSIEEQFYLFWPLFIFLLTRTKHLRTTLIFLFLFVLTCRSLCFYFNGRSGNAFTYYTNTFFRMDALILGALLSLLHRQNTSIPPKPFALLFIGSAGTLICAFAIFHIPFDAMNPFYQTVGYSIVAIFAACLIHMAVKYPQKFPAVLLANTALRFVGRISYGLYVFHFFILQLLSVKLNHWYAIGFPRARIPSGLFAALLCLAISFVLACLSFNLLEKPFLRLKSHPNAPLDTSFHSRY